MIKLSKDFFAGTVVGLGAGLFGREIYSSAGGVRQVGRSLIRTAMVSYDKALEGISYVKETIEDLAAEAKAEIAARREGAPPSVATSGTPVTSKSNGLQEAM